MQDRRFRTQRAYRRISGGIFEPDTGYPAFEQKKKAAERAVFIRQLTATVV